VTENQKYQVLEQFPRFEVRQYPAHVVAEVDVTGSFESAGNQGFRPLVSYIGGQNIAHTKVHGTSPSTQTEVATERIAMTAPVVQHAADEAGKYVVSFVMPNGSELDSLPAPSDPKVRLREIPPHKAAVLRFTGRWSAGSYDEKAAMLRSMLAEQGFSLNGPMRFARYDPPWTPWFMRRNEVIAPIND
jgi:hypothetical protein